MVSSAGQIRDPDVVVRLTADGNWLVALTFLQEVDGVWTALQTVYRLSFKIPNQPRLLPVIDFASPNIKYPQLVSKWGKQCLSPNVDIGQEGTAVFVFEAQNQIFARVRELKTLADAVPAFLSLGYATHPVAITDPAQCFQNESSFQVSQPDVAVGEPTVSSFAPMAHIVYVRRSNDLALGGYHERVIVSSETITQLQQPSVTATCSDQVAIYSYWADPDNLGLVSSIKKPRIASTYDPQQPWRSVNGYLVAMQERRDPTTNGNSETEIMTYANVGNNAYTIKRITTRGFPGTSVCLNSEPAITMWGERGVVDWTYANSHLTCFPNYVQQAEVIGQATEVDGSVTPLNSPQFPRVNDNEVDSQHTPSVSGGHSSGTEKTAPNMLHVWVDDRDHTIRWREAESGAPSYRPAGGDAPTSYVAGAALSVVPSPADAGAAVRLVLGSDEQVINLAVIDVVTGKPVLTPPSWAGDLPTAESDGVTWVPLATLLPASALPGLYVVRLQTTRTTHNVRFQLQTN